MLVFSAICVWVSFFRFWVFLSLIASLFTPEGEDAALPSPVIFAYPDVSEDEPFRRANLALRSTRSPPLSALCLSPAYFRSKHEEHRIGSLHLRVVHSSSFSQPRRASRAGPK